MCLLFKVLHNDASIQNFLVIANYSKNVCFLLSVISISHFVTVEVMKQPCKVPTHFGFILATSGNSIGQFTIAKELAYNIFGNFVAIGSKAGATVLKPDNGVEEYLKDTPANFRRKLDSLPSYSGSYSVAQLAISIEEAILQLIKEAPKLSNKLLVLIIDVKDLDMAKLHVLAPLTRRELVLNDIKLFIVAVGSSEKSTGLRSLTAYADEVLIRERFDNLLDHGFTTSIAVSLCQTLCECFSIILCISFDT